MFEIGNRLVNKITKEEVTVYNNNIGNGLLLVFVTKPQEVETEENKVYVGQVKVVADIENYELIKCNLESNTSGVCNNTDVAACLFTDVCEYCKTRRLAKQVGVGG